MAILSYFARGDSQTANNNSLNVSNTNQVPTTQLVFEDFGGSGDLSLDLNGGQPDPDTRVYVGGDTSGTPLSFTVEFRGNLPNSGRLANVGDPPDTVDLRDVEITVITLQTGERLFLITDDDPQFANIFAFDPTIPGAGDQAFDVMDDFPKGAFKIENLVVCFAAGTMIRIAEGSRRVEELCVGDLVRTEQGVAPIRLVSRRTVTAAEMCDSAALRPVVIPSGSLGQGVPERDLVLTGTHRIKISDPGIERIFGLEAAFVQARDLPVARPAPIRDTVLVHFLCDDHVVVDANGCPSESLFPGDMALMALSAEERACYAAHAARMPRQTAYPCLTATEASVWRESLQRRAYLTA